MSAKAAIINVRSFTHPHLRSIYEEGLWGIPDNRVNRTRWEALTSGSKVLLYGEYGGKRGAWALCRLRGKELALNRPIRYWDPPTGYPLLVWLEPEVPSELSDPSALEGITPVGKEELASAFGFIGLRERFDRWSIYTFREAKGKGVTYPISRFEAALNEFLARNRTPVRPRRPDHEAIKEMIYQIGLMQGKFPAKEYPIEDRRIDVVWRRTARSVPYVAWEVCLGGDLFKDLSKLKHAFDIWNSIPVLVTTAELLDEARRWVEGSFHEIADALRLIPWERVRRFYEAKSAVKELETELGVL